MKSLVSSNLYFSCLRCTVNMQQRESSQNAALKEIRVPQTGSLAQIHFWRIPGEECIRWGPSPQGEKELVLFDEQEGNAVPKSWADLCDKCEKPGREMFLLSRVGHSKVWSF